MSKSAASRRSSSPPGPHIPGPFPAPSDPSPRSELLARGSVDIRPTTLPAALDRHVSGAAASLPSWSASGATTLQAGASAAVPNSEGVGGALSTGTQGRSDITSSWASGSMAPPFAAAAPPLPSSAALSLELSLGDKVGCTEALPAGTTSPSRASPGLASNAAARSSPTGGHSSSSAWQQEEPGRTLLEEQLHELQHLQQQQVQEQQRQLQHLRVQQQQQQQRVQEQQQQLQHLRVQQLLTQQLQLQQQQQLPPPKQELDLPPGKREVAEPVGLSLERLKLERYLDPRALAIQGPVAGQEGLVPPAPGQGGLPTSPLACGPGIQQVEDLAHGLAQERSEGRQVPSGTALESSGSAVVASVAGSTSSAGVGPNALALLAAMGLQREQARIRSGLQGSMRAGMGGVGGAGAVGQGQGGEGQGQTLGSAAKSLLRALGIEASENQAASARLAAALRAQVAATATFPPEAPAQFSAALQDLQAARASQAMRDTQGKQVSEGSDTLSCKPEPPPTPAGVPSSTAGSSASLGAPSALHGGRKPPAGGVVQILGHTISQARVGAPNQGTDASRTERLPAGSSPALLRPLAALPSPTPTPADSSGLGASEASDYRLPGSASQGARQEESMEGLSRYELQKRRDWRVFGEYLSSLTPPVAQSSFCGQQVVEFLAYLDQFGKTKVHQEGCHFFGQGGFQACECPMKQAWGSLDSLIGRLRSAYDENGGRPEVNPFAERVVRQYLKDVRDEQLRARGAEASKKRKRRSKAGASTGAGGGRGAGGAQQESARSEGHSGSGMHSNDGGEEPLQRHSSMEQTRPQGSRETEPSGLFTRGRPAQRRSLLGASLQQASLPAVQPRALAPGASGPQELGGSSGTGWGRSGGGGAPG